MKMFRKSKRILSIVVLAFILNSCYLFAPISADENQIVIDRVTQTFYGNTQTQKAFSWYMTTNPSKPVIQYAPLAEYSGGTVLAKNVDQNLSAITKGNVVAGSKSKVQNTFGTEYFCTVLLKNLQPGTSYVYRVGDLATNTWSDLMLFTTDKQNSDEFQFIHVTDPQADTQREYNVNTQTIQAAVSNFPNNQFVVCTGDFVNDSSNENQWQMVLNSFSTVQNMTMVPITGNHDSGDWHFINHFNLDKPTIDPMKNGAYYSFNYGNAHFVVLNSNTSAGILDIYQEKWLNNDLVANDKRWTIVMMHHSLFSDSYHRDDSDVREMRRTLTKLFTKYKVDMVLSGHDHVFLRTVPMNGAKPGEVSYIEIDENGQKVQYEKYSGNTTYILNRSSAVKTYYPHLGNGAGADNKYHDYTNDPIIWPAAYGTKNLTFPMFSTVKVTKDKLIYDTFTVNRANQQIEQVDSYKVYKDKNYSYSMKNTYSVYAKTKLLKKAKAKSRTVLNLKRNTKLTYLGKKGSYFKVKVKKKVGYILKTKVKIKGAWNVTVKKKVPGRKNPSAKAKIKSNFSKSDVLMITDKVGNFGKVERDGTWIDLRKTKK